jgi:hypothetical protein
VVGFLVNQGASLDARDGAGVMPLELAESMARDDAGNNEESRRQIQVVELLRNGSAGRKRKKGR